MRRVFAHAAHGQAIDEGPRVSVGFGPVQRDIRDYESSSSHAWGTGLAAAIELRANGHGSVLVSGSRSHFRDLLTIPPLVDRNVQGARLDLSTALTSAFQASRGGWDPANASGFSDLTTYEATGDYRQYLIPSMRRAGPYVGAGLGFTRLSTHGMDDIRAVMDATAGMHWHIGHHIAVYGEARYDWLNVTVSGEGQKSPRWLVTPIRGGIVVQP